MPSSLFNRKKERGLLQLKKSIGNVKRGNENWNRKKWGKKKIPLKRNPPLKEKYIHSHTNIYQYQYKYSIK